MSESEWMTSTDPLRMLAYLNVDPDSSKALKFLVTRCLRCWDKLPDICKPWVKLVERATVNPEAFAEFHNVEMFERVNDALLSASALSDGSLGGRIYAIQNIVAADWIHEWPISNCTEWANERKAQADLVRNMFSYE